MKTLTDKQQLYTLLPIIGIFCIFYYIKIGNLDIKFKPHSRILDISAIVQALSIVVLYIIINSNLI